MKRDWVGATASSSEDNITLLQWNILAQSLGEYGDFSLCPVEALQWQHRKDLLLKEILSHGADIMCLEEVDCFNDLSCGLNTVGYSGIWAPKPDSPCLKFKNNMGPDGNAIFFSREKFSLIKSYHHVLQKEDGSYTNSTVIVCELLHLKSGKEITFLATHFKAKETPEFAEVRRNQAIHIVKLVQDIMNKKKSNIILAGDFNATNDEPAIKLIKDGGLISAYETICGSEPEYTTWKIRGERGASPVSEKKRTIDFVFNQSDDIKPAAVLQVPDGEEIGKGRLPHMEFPSDHMSLVVKFNV